MLTQDPSKTKVVSTTTTTKAVSATSSKKDQALALLAKYKKEKAAKAKSNPLAQPASCGALTIAPVAGGTPVKNANGCITGFIVGL